MKNAPPVSLKAARNDTERRLLVAVRSSAIGGTSQAAKAINISRPAFYELLAKHEIDTEHYKGEGKPKA